MRDTYSVYSELSGHKMRVIHLYRVISNFPQLADKILENSGSLAEKEIAVVENLLKDKNNMFIC